MGKPSYGIIITTPGKKFGRLVEVHGLANARKERKKLVKHYGAERVSKIANLSQARRR